jgi:hypothetical protein
VSEELVVSVDDELLAVDGCQVTSGHFMSGSESHSIHACKLASVTEHKWLVTVIQLWVSL